VLEPYVKSHQKVIERMSHDTFSISFQKAEEVIKRIIEKDHDAVKLLVKVLIVSEEASPLRTR